MERTFSDKEVIGYLSSMIDVCRRILEAAGMLDGHVVGNGPSLRQMIDTAQSVAKTNRIRV
ncbi:MAG: hypothetical protein ABFE13_06290 [Phycisphaerales bacterium]